MNFETVLERVQRLGFDYETFSVIRTHIVIKLKNSYSIDITFVNEAGKSQELLKVYFHKFWKGQYISSSYKEQFINDKRLIYLADILS